MKHLKVHTVFALSLFLTTHASSSVWAQERVSKPPVVLGHYEYEAKPADDEFIIFNPRKAPAAAGLIFEPGDKLAICGDSITEQKMYSRIIETYLTVCQPDLRITVRQYGWSGEKTDGFLNRMDNDCLRFEPDVATLCYGMNDARYRPFDVTNGLWYRDHYTAIVRKFQNAGTDVIVGSPGCSGRLAEWVRSRSGNLEEHNLALCSFRDIAISVAQDENARFADIFWPMYVAKVHGEKQYSTADEKYEIAGKDGIHPGWAGHVIMAYAFLNAMGVDGNIGHIEFDYANSQATADKGHEVAYAGEHSIKLVSHRYPYCASGPTNKDNSIRSGMSWVPFSKQLNQLTLVVTNLPTEHAVVHWGDQQREFSREQLSHGVNLAEAFELNPFSSAFNQVDEAVAVKQAFETKQIKEIFHGQAGKADMEKAVNETEAERAVLVERISEAFGPVEHTIRIEAKP